MNPLVKKNILGIDITDASRREVLEYIFNFLQKREEKMYIVTPNPEMVMSSRKHPQVREVLNRAGLSLCDGAGLFLAAKFLGKPLPERISGTDFMEELCKESVKNAVTVGFLGGRRGVAERVVECLVSKYPGLQVAYVAEEWSFEGFTTAEHSHGTTQNKTQNHAEENVSEVPRTVQHSSAMAIDILFVAFGHPKQELWMAEHLKELPVRIMMGVGGAFDYLSGDVSRAPGPVRSLGLEWLYRLMCQPWRFKRQTALFKFMVLVVKQRLRG